MKKIRIKPGKVQSVIAMCVGAAFCLVGIFYVIPVFGPFGFLWTLFAAALAIVNALNVFTDRGVASEIIEVEAKESDDQTPEQRLEAAKRLLLNGDISEGEYEEKRKQILKEL